MRRRYRNEFDIYKAGIAIIFVLVLVVALLIGSIVYSAANSVSEGRLVDKYHEVKYSRSVSGTSGVCVYNDIELWKLIVVNGSKRDVWIVSEDFYNSSSIGDWVKKR